MKLDIQNNNKKIVILALHLGYGGIEKFIVNIANMFSNDYEVEIISAYKLYSKPAFEIDSKVKITYLLEENLVPNKARLLQSIKKVNIFDIAKQVYIATKVLTLRRYRMINAIKNIQTSVVISTRYTHNNLLGKYGEANLIKIATEHNYYLNNKSSFKKVIKSCKKVNFLVLSTKEQADFYKDELGEKKVLNIPLALDTFPNDFSNLDTKQITYIGRLEKEKGVLDLIDVFKVIKEESPECVLNIVGDGSKKEDLQARIKEYDLEKNVILYGYKDRREIEKILLNTSIGINTSYIESFGLAVLETLSYGIPCIAFDSAKGILELIDNEKNGYIINNRNKEEMAKKVTELLENKGRLIGLGNNAKEKSLKFSQDNIKQMWETAIN
ncbi:MAG: glycosyltransferase [Lachnospiraceae bacterium]|jgi:N-acetylglucosaminyldiphosphoundecaprenol N-acetyl-beta-D-mannosaminyltransferase|nr:glycosyltransferase [Lachnospiraceae bacterium]